MPEAGRHPVVRRAVAVVAATSVLGGCARVDPAIYDPLRDLAREIGVEEVGPVLAESTWGTGGFSSSLPSLAYVVGGCHAYARLTERVAASGYELQRDDSADNLPWSSWSRLGRRGTETVFVAERTPRTEVQFGDLTTAVALPGCGTEIQLGTWRRP